MYFWRNVLHLSFLVGWQAALPFFHRPSFLVEQGFTLCMWENALILPNFIPLWVLYQPQIIMLSCNYLVVSLATKVAWYLSLSQPEGQEWDYCFCQSQMFIRSCVRSFVWHTLVSGLSFLNQTTWDLAFWHSNRSYQDLAWACLSTSFTYIWLGYYLFSVIGIGYWPLILEPDQLAFSLFPFDLGHDLLSISHITWQTVPCGPIRM